MSGHSKWANIQHKKGANDKKRASIFTKIIRELTVAAKEGGTNPDGNPRLRMAIIKARAANMPKDTMKKNFHHGYNLFNKNKKSLNNKKITLDNHQEFSSLYKQPEHHQNLQVFQLMPEFYQHDRQILLDTYPEPL